MEEWVMPGGFDYYYNICSDPFLRVCYLLNELPYIITNFGGAVVWLLLLQMNIYERQCCCAVMLFGYAELAIHVLGASASRTLLLESGVYSPFYGPGLLTSIVCWAAPVHRLHSIFC